ncbi:hypothetical protein PHYSODRAFT_265238 [Phytophthora sojae]|uniref:RxLR effector protein n=2 Tax=Phytophthora sojae TaxID=67593 RepID=G4ZL21_PHYSP|nr:hypothetical protein PHYSODRAFT_265238 [Phytophthora sojae]AEK81177.1 Avh328 [Phytophthora sojae]AEK81179.1 Avh328 [Phytophthora sojae]EGZ15243.1 hypothetical protein PHYSODRAFT_265238 [Phytophthora sojae]|eukprot:XP_009528992.1 hypothetical protein PHYSODRAFT_265238 [Phytophthora sojae]
MCFFHVEVLMAVALLTITTAADSTPAKTSTGVALRDDRTNSGRILRTVDRNSEERGIASSVAMWAKVKYWAHAGKSDEYVKQRVGMAGLTGKALEFDPNYKYLERFWHRLEGRTLDKWVRNGLRHTEPGWA